MSLLFMFNQRPPYHLDLFNAAGQFLKDNHPAVALITAHRACEIRAEQVMTEAFDARDAADLAKLVMGGAGGSNLANDKVRELYTTLTGDEIQHRPFWATFKGPAQFAIPPCIAVGK